LPKIVTSIERNELKREAILKDFEFGGEMLIFRPEFKFYGALETDVFEYNSFLKMVFHRSIL